MLAFILILYEAFNVLDNGIENKYERHKLW